MSVNNDVFAPLQPRDKNGSNASDLPSSTNLGAQVLGNPGRPQLGRVGTVRNTIPPFVPYPGNPIDSIDIIIDEFLCSHTFELICVQAAQLAAVLPTSPPPRTFISFENTPMHQWYQALLMEFIANFMHKLRLRNMFPTRDAFGRNRHGQLILIRNVEDAEAFNTEVNAHINAILASFHHNYGARYLGSMEGLSVDTSRPNAGVAALALQETVSRATWPPKRGWKVGEPLHSEYRRRLRMVEYGIMRLMYERHSVRWMLGMPKRFSRGLNAYKEYYLRVFRASWG